MKYTLYKTIKFHGRGDPADGSESCPCAECAAITESMKEEDDS